jgi:hypothetical protein
VTPTPAPTPVSAPAPAPVVTPGAIAPVTGSGETPAPDETPASDVKGQEDTGSAPSAQSGTGTDTAPVAAAAPATTQEASAGELPFTGVNAWWLALLGLTAAGTGVVIRRRVAPDR